ncbi:hypothetical protein FA13DRAFT_1708412 [Coprinellus micaceus]|uniref:Uncharacterized protein n=1 Tax=Coprinellus micaceus TaxID=71717 RepID=A0A4Y7THK7_COPMI|nr:hypothetical protein FA13DRAFT_1708412 [Coprinellus micaceus]
MTSLDTTIHPGHPHRTPQPHPQPPPYPLAYHPFHLKTWRPRLDASRAPMTPTLNATVNPSQSPMCLKECPTPCVRPPTLPTCYTTPPRAIPPMRHLVTTTDGYNKGICGRRWSGVGECPAFPNERMPSRRMSHLQAGPTKGVAAPLVTILGLNLNVTEYRSNSLPVTLQVLEGSGRAVVVARSVEEGTSCQPLHHHADQSALGNEDRRQGREIQENPSGAEGRPGFFPVVPPSAAQARKVEVEVEGVSRLMKKGWCRDDLGRSRVAWRTMVYSEFAVRKGGSDGRDVWMGGVTTCGSGDYPALLVEAEARAEGDEWSMERAGLYGERLRIVVLEDSFDKRHHRRRATDGGEMQGFDTTWRQWNWDEERDKEGVARTMTVESCDFPKWNGTSWPSDVNGSEYGTANMRTGTNVHCCLIPESLGGGEHPVNQRCPRLFVQPSQNGSYDRVGTQWITPETSPNLRYIGYHGECRT